MPTLQLSIVRFAILSFCVLPVAIHIFFRPGYREPWLIPALVLGLGFSPLVAAFGRRWMQYAIRGGWFAGLCWSFLGLYKTQIFFPPGLWALGFAGALLVTGWVRTQDGDRCSAVAFKRTLSTSLVFGFADFTTLMFISVVFVSTDGPVDWALVGLCSGSAAGLGVALIGLYHMRVWGLLFCLTMNLVVVGWLALGVVNFPVEITFMLCTTAAIQLLLPTPILWTILRNRKKQVAK